MKITTETTTTRPMRMNGLMLGLALTTAVADGQGTFTSSTTQPATDGADQAYFNANTPSTAPGSDKWWAEISGAGQTKGQTFTLTQSVLLKAMTYRLGNTKALPTKVYVIRVGVVDTATNTFFPVHTEEITQNVDWGDAVSDSYGTWTLASPLTLPALPAGTVYGFDIAMKSSTSAWQTGIPYPKYENTNVFAGGFKYTCAQTGTTGSATNTVQPDSGRDREFHLDMEAATITDTTPPKVTSIDDQVGGGPIYEDQVQVTYLLKFDEAIDAATIDLTDFENLGSGVSINSVVSVQNPNPYPVASVVKVVLGVSGTGTLQLGIKSGSNIADVAGNPVTSPVADDTTITVNAGTNPAGGTRWWDGATTTGVTDGVSQGGTATWDTTTTNWDRGFGFAAPVAWNNANNDSAFFAGTAGTVTVAGPVNLKDMSFDIAGQYTIDGGTLNFAPGATIRTGDNRYDQTITSVIAGSPAVETKDFGAGNTYKGLIFAPAGGTQTLGAILNPNNTGNTDKAGVTFAGSTTGNTVASIAYAGGDRYADTNFASGEWTVAGNITTGTVKVTGGTHTLGGTVRCDYNEVRVTGGSVKGEFTIFTNDRRGSPYVATGGTLAPGNGVGVVTVAYGTGGGTPAVTVNDYSFSLRTGSIYEWQVGAANATDTIHITEGGLFLQDFTLKVLDAGGTPAATDHLPVFTYDPAKVATRNLSGFLGKFDTSALGAGWTVGTLALTDDGAGTIYLTGLSKTAASSPYDTWTAAKGLTGTDALPTADVEPDTLSNLLEFAFGTNPKVADLGPLGWSGSGAATPGSPVVNVNYPGGGGVDFTARFLRRKDHGTSGSVAYAWQFSSDLADWESSDDTPQPSWYVAPTDLADDTSGSYDLLEVPYPIFLDNGKKARFFRLAVSQVP